jgi:type II secretory pathway component PulC
MTPSQLTRTINWIAMPIALALLAMVAYQIYQRHYVSQTNSRNYQFDDLPTLNKASVTADINSIINKHVFGVVPSAPKPLAPVVVKKEAPKQAPKTRLNIKLTGIIDGATPETGMAMLEVDRGRTLVVAVGEKIGKTDAILHQVLPEEILIDREGTIESVKMIRKTLEIVRLDPTLLSALPQPYIEQSDEQASNQQNYQPTIPNAPVKTVSAYQPQPQAAVSTANSSLDAPPLPDNAVENATSSAVSGSITRYSTYERKRRRPNGEGRPVPQRLKNLSN